MRQSASTSVVFPAPVGPTIASVAPAGSENEIRSRIRRPSTSIVRSRTSIDGAPIVSPVRVAGPSAMRGAVSNRSRTRVQAAIPRCQIPMIQPSAMVGHESNTR